MFPLYEDNSWRKTDAIVRQKEASHQQLLKITAYKLYYYVLYLSRLSTVMVGPTKSLLKHMPRLLMFWPYALSVANGDVLSRPLMPKFREIGSVYPCSRL
jgi:hypothetical protein